MTTTISEAIPSVAPPAIKTLRGIVILPHWRSFELLWDAFKWFSVTLLWPYVSQSDLYSPILTLPGVLFTSLRVRREVSMCEPQSQHQHTPKPGWRSREVINLAFGRSREVINLGSTTYLCQLKALWYFLSEWTQSGWRSLVFTQQESTKSDASDLQFYSLLISPSTLIHSEKNNNRKKTFGFLHIKHFNKHNDRTKLLQTTL